MINESSETNRKFATIVYDNEKNKRLLEWGIKIAQYLILGIDV